MNTDADRRKKIDYLMGKVRKTIEGKADDLNTGMPDDVLNHIVNILQNTECHVEGVQILIVNDNVKEELGRTGYTPDMFRYHTLN